MTITVEQQKATNVRPRVVGSRTEVPLWNGERVRYVNLDSAASTPPLAKVRQVVDEFASWYSSVHRGAGYKSRLSTYLYENARDVVMRFVGTTPRTHVVVFVRNTTEALNLLAHRTLLEEDELVLCTKMEHHSNLLPWLRKPHEVVQLTEDGRVDMDDLKQRLERHKGKVKLVTISAASNVTGLMADIKAVARLVHAHGAKLAVDAAQLTPHRALSMGTPGTADCIDVVAFSGHKLYAPYGAGALVVPATLFADGDPMLVGGGTACLVTSSGVKWATGSDLEEAGSPNVVGVVAMAAALEELMRYGMDQVAKHERELTRYAVRRLRTVPGLRLFGPTWDSMLTGGEDRLGVFCFTIDGQPYEKVAAVLANEWGVGVRSGCFCAHLYVSHLLGVSDEDAADSRERLISGLPVDLPGMVRASLGLANSKSDIDRLVSGLQAITRGEIRAQYEHNEHGDLEPVGDQHLFEAHGASFMA
ncbi:aminotransferase class V-fold PLP-dependent enzyme [Ktedonospora formicarum]|uniref:Class V aminotransferase n=1 Tax=Ktedonospora formicarum TaxID=2778364 RepID=A0A8J3MSX7_9CHLR|nr:aminotransferase class V-fold PLP-dependent enzyme [Ktedonospora formicarum]GHO45073.1 class V aminotransferase [Ktedonospora formicarum]